MSLCLPPPFKSWAPAWSSSGSEEVLGIAVFYSNNSKPCRENHHHWHLTLSQDWNCCGCWANSNAEAIFQAQQDLGVIWMCLQYLQAPQLHSELMSVA